MDEQTERHAKKIIESWLQIATDGLCVEAKERIGAEVTAHFMDAMEEEIEAGASPVEAFQKNYLALGDPNESRRSFRRVYLTEAEKTELKKLQQPLKWKRLDWIFPGFILAFYLAFTLRSNSTLFSWTDLKNIVLLQAFVIVLQFPSYIPQLLYRKFGPRITFALLISLSFIYPIVLFLIMRALLSLAAAWIYGILGLLNLFRGLFLYGPVLRKVGRNSETAK